MRKILQVFREQGFGGLFSRILHAAARNPKPLSGSIPIRLLVKTEDASEVDWRIPHPAVLNPIKITKSKLTIAWIISPPGKSSGGHQNIFRFINFLEQAGHVVRIYIYSSHEPFTLSAIREALAVSPSYPRFQATIESYSEKGVSEDVDAIFATGWETAYASFLDASLARRFYFVQDFEPCFTPAGSASVFAENTYRFGFHGITAGRFLANKLSTDYEMPVSYYNFGIDHETYHLTNTEPRKEIFFYARPVTERRGFELGIMALAHFAKERPEYVINLAGWDVKQYQIPFNYVNLSDLAINNLNAVYNRCSAGLVISLTNMSLLPLELLSAGVIPVLNDGPNNRLVSNNPFIEYSQASPKALAEKLLQIVDRQDLVDYSKAASDSVSAIDWKTSGQEFVSIFESVIHG